MPEPASTLRVQDDAQNGARGGAQAAGCRDDAGGAQLRSSSEPESRCAPVSQTLARKRARGQASPAAAQSCPGPADDGADLRAARPFQTAARSVSTPKFSRASSSGLRSGGAAKLAYTRVTHSVAPGP